MRLSGNCGVQILPHPISYLLLLDFELCHLFLIQALRTHQPQLTGIDIASATHQTKMQMRTGGSSGGAYTADDLAPLYRLSATHAVRIEMSVKRDHSAGVLDAHFITITSVVSGRRNRTICHSVNGSTSARTLVYTLMVCPSTREGIQTFAER